MNPLTIYTPHAPHIGTAWFCVFIVTVVMMCVSILALCPIFRNFFGGIAETVRGWYARIRKQPVQFIFAAVFVCVFVQYGATKGTGPVQENITALELSQPVETPNGVDFTFQGKDGFDLTGKRVAIERRKLGAGLWKRIATVDGQAASAHIDGFTLDVTYQYRARVLEAGEE